MIDIQISQRSCDKLFRELDRKFKGIQSVKSSYNMENIGKAIFTISTKAFLRDIGIYAVGNPKYMHHVYEWNKTGSNKYKLFNIVRTSVRGGNLSIGYRFTKSSSTVPIPSRLKRSGKNGKSVKSTHVFANKAALMESGKGVVITAKNAKFLAFPSKKTKSGIVFIPRGTFVYNPNPGGKYVKGSFNRYINKWFNNSTNINKAINSTALLKNLELEVAKSLRNVGSGTPNVSSAIKKVSDQYSKGVTII